MEIYPMKLKPCFKETPWGGNSLNELYQKNTGFKITGESWEVSAHRNGRSTILNGAYAGMNLLEMTEKFGHEFMGNNVNGDLFPVLFKLIDARDKLSVQVHPTDDYAKANENDYGKTEMWTVLQAEEGAGLYLGFKKPITKDEYANLISENNLESALEFVPAEVGKSYFLPAGLVHAIGSGLLIAEIQQSSDSTYRVYDWGRMGLDGKPRQLHVAKALDVSRTEWKGGVAKSLVGTVQNGVCEWLSVCNYFAANKLTLKGECLLPVEKNSFHIYFAAEGEMTVTVGNNSVSVSKGESVIVPAGIENVALSGDVTLFRYFVPESQQLCYEEMVGQNIPENEVKQFLII